MSAEACIVCLGVRFEIDPDDIGALEARTDPRVQAARQIGLKYFWANFGDPGELFLLFIGDYIRVLGGDNSAELVLRPGELPGLTEATRAKLTAAGIVGEPALYVQWLADA